MKKLLSVFAAAAMLFGFASCSGDLHDKTYSPINLDGYVISGGWDAWSGNLVEGLSGTSATYADVSPAADGSYLVFVPNNGDTYIKTLEAGTMPEGVKIGGVDDGFGGINPTIEGLKAGYTYTIKLDTATGVALVSVEITSSPAPVEVQPIDYSKLVVLNGNFGSVDVVWNGTVGTAIIPKGNDMSAWGSASPTMEFALCEDASWNGKYCGATLAAENKPEALEAGAGNAKIPNLGTPLSKDVVITFVYVVPGTWLGDQNDFASSYMIRASYSFK